jgi:RNA polymerase sigma-70 factor (ECF subfamily)
MTEPGEAAVSVPQLGYSVHGGWSSDYGPGHDLLDELLGRASQGDELAVERLVVAAHSMVVRYCRARLGGRLLGAHADDVAHEIDIAVRRVLHHQRIVGERLPSLVYGIAFRKVAEAGHKSRCGTFNDHDSPATAQSDQPTPRENESTKIQRALEVIAPYEREVLILRIVVGLSCKHTAQTLGLAPREVKAIQHRGMNQLRRTLGVPDEPN